jgi:hypothetical protein
MEASMKTIGELARAAAPSPQQLTLTLNASSERLAMSAKYAKLLLGCYRIGDANDPEIYTAAVMAVLAEHPEDIMRAVVDPRAGLPARSQWLPTVKEVRDACAAATPRQSFTAEWDQRAKAQLAERAAIEAAKGFVSPPKDTGRAVVLVPASNPLYAAMVARSQDNGVDRREFRHDRVRGGLWVVESWLQGARFR